MMLSDDQMLLCGLLCEVAIIGLAVYVLHPQPRGRLTLTVALVLLNLLFTVAPLVKGYWGRGGIR